jgi:hypothetical protein
MTDDYGNKRIEGIQHCPYCTCSEESPCCSCIVYDMIKTALDKIQDVFRNGLPKVGEWIEGHRFNKRCYCKNE